MHEAIHIGSQVASSTLYLIKQGLSVKFVQEKTGISRATYFRLKRTTSAEKHPEKE